MDITINNECFTLATIYVPNVDDPYPFICLSEQLNNCTGSSIILGRVLIW